MPGLLTVGVPVRDRGLQRAHRRAGHGHVRLRARRSAGSSAASASRCSRPPRAGAWRWARWRRSRWRRRSSCAARCRRRRRGRRRPACRVATLRRLLANRALVAACLTGAGLFFSFMGVFSYIDFRLERPPFSLSPAVIGLVFVLWVMGAAGPLAGRLADRHGWRAVALGGLLLCAGGLTLSLVPVLGVVIVGLSLVTLGNFSAVTAAQLGVAGATDRDRGVASAMYFSAYYVAGALGAYVPGLAWEQWHWTGVWAMAIAAYAVGVGGADRGGYPGPSVRSFACDTCGQLVFFENTVCLRCGSDLGFEPRRRELVTLSAGRGALREPRAGRLQLARRRDGGAVRELRLTRTRPADDDIEGIERFRDAEAAKRWLLFELGELGLPVQSWREREGGLAFELLSSERGAGDDRPRRRRRHARRGRVRRRAPRGAARAARRALSHRPRALPPRDRPLLLAAARPRRPGARALPRAVRRRARGLRRGARAPLRERSAVRLVAALRQRLRDDAPVGGLGGDLRPLPAHLGHAADGRRLRRRRARRRGPGARRRRLPGSCSRTGCR